MFYAQLFVALSILVSLLVNLYRDINGIPAKKPAGYVGVISTLILTAVVVFIYYLAGAFSTLI